MVKKNLIVLTEDTKFGKVITQPGLLFCFIHQSYNAFCILDGGFLPLPAFSILLKIVSLVLFLLSHTWRQNKT